MACSVEMLDNGQVVDVHRFDTHENAVNFLTRWRRYTFDRHETWGTTSGVDLYQGPEPKQRAALRERGGLVKVVFWEN